MDNASDSLRLATRLPILARRLRRARPPHSAQRARARTGLRAAR